MRVLIVTAYYPPCKLGYGYMRICQWVAEGLAKAGHSLAVLTSDCVDGEEISSFPVHRLLTIDPDWDRNLPVAIQFFWGRRSREKKSVERFQQLVENFSPDIIFIWHANGLPRFLLQAAENLPTAKAVYYIANYFPELTDDYVRYWQADTSSGVTGLIKAGLAQSANRMLAAEGKPIPLEFRRSICVSDYVRRRLVDQRLIGPDAVTIYNGVDIDMFSQKDAVEKGCSRPVKCVVAGRVAEEKGIHTVLLAFAIMRNRNRLQDLELTMVGDGPQEYRKRLNQIITDHNLQEYISFRPPVPLDDMPALLAENDVMILASEWDEPLACIMLEGMASGIAVIGTANGGNGEILLHEKTGLVFEAGNPESLADQLSQLLTEPDLISKLGCAGRDYAVAHLDHHERIWEIERYLLGVIESRNDGESTSAL